MGEPILARLQELRTEQPSVCWRPDPLLTQVCIKDYGHANGCGWEPSVGICTSTAYGFGDELMGCVLRHGHAGMHEDGHGCSWGPPPMPDIGSMPERN